EQVRFYDESVAVAEHLLRDNRARVQVGKAAELDVQEAEAGLALRQTKKSEAQQKLIEAANRLITFYSGKVMATNAAVRASESPQPNVTPLSFFEGWQDAFDLNPDYLSRRKQAT